MKNAEKAAETRRRPLLKRDIETAQLHTQSGHDASRYLNVSYGTYKKYAKIYGLFEHHKNPHIKGVARPKIKGAYGLESILAGNHPFYDRFKLKERLIAAGYLPNSCAMCGYDKHRYPNGKVPLVIHTKDGTLNFFPLDNIELLCYNCTYITTGHIAERSLMNVTTHNEDLLASGALSIDEITEMQTEFMQGND